MKTSSKTITDEYKDIEELSPMKSDNIAKKYSEKNRFRNISPCEYCIKKLNTNLNYS